eukprot:COSAG02_NODE_3211_length_7164_cov_5.234820_3_plen_65_part_00
MHPDISASLVTIGAVEILILIISFTTVSIHQAIPRALPRLHLKIAVFSPSKVPCALHFQKELAL